MALKIGSTDVSKIYLGSTPVKSVYLGSTKIWPVSKYYDISTASRDGETNLYPILYATNIERNGDGSMFYFFRNTKHIYQYSTSVNYSISSMTQIKSVYLSAINNLTNYGRSDSGNKVHAVDWIGKRIYQFIASTPYDVSTLTYDKIANISQNPLSFFWSNNGNYIYIGDSNIKKYSVGSPYDIGTVTDLNQDISLSGGVRTGSMTRNGDGSLFYIGDYNDETLKQYTVTSNYDVSTISYDTSIDVSGDIEKTSGVLRNNDGSRLFLSGGASYHAITEYNVG